MGLRLKGQEVAVRIVKDNVLLQTLTDIRSLEVTPQFEILSEGYLGETTTRRDEVFTGCTGRIELHFENGDILDLINDIINRARRREPGVKVNIFAAFNFPEPGTPRRLVQIMDCFFGPVPIGFGSRTEFGTVTLEFESSTVQFLN